MEVRRDPRSFIFFIILLLLINSPEPRGQQGFDVRSRYDEVLQHERDELDVLNRTRYGDLDPNKNKWLNITGLNEEDGFVWELLAPVQRRAAEQTRNLLGASADGYLDGASEEKAPVYRNITGYVQGEWARSSLSRVRHPSDINSTTIFEHIHPAEFDRNITGTGGMVRLRISEKEQATYENRTVSEVSATMVIGDHDSTGRNWWEFTLHGVHFPHLGGVVLTTTSDK
jgi:mitofusin